MAKVSPDLTAVIDGKIYAIEEWVVQQVGRLLKEDWKEGFAGGMGQAHRRRGDAQDRLYFTDEMDGSTGVLRLRPKDLKSDLGLTNFDSTLPVYTFVAEDSGGRAYLYALNGQRAYKIDIAAQALDETKDFGAGAVCGRPVLWKGTWYVPLGNSVDYVKLTTVAVP